MKLRLIYIILLVGLVPLSAAGQREAHVIDWEFLSDVKFVDKYFKEYEAWYLVPEFSEKVSKLNQQQVIIKGYVIPLDVDGGEYALSAYPFSACFFCGGAGPETVMSLKFEEKPRRYKTDEIITFTGVLELNQTEFDNFSYVLRKAKALKK